jgi:hypothetical protein
MNIQPVKSEAVPAPAKPKTAPPKAPEARPESETHVAASEARLRDILSKQPATRPDVVERGKSYAADPNYPATDLLARLAEMFVDGRKSGG